jgi:hypothetical protein
VNLRFTSIPSGFVGSVVTSIPGIHVPHGCIGRVARRGYKGDANDQRRPGALYQNQHVWQKRDAWDNSTLTPSSKHANMILPNVR